MPYCVTLDEGETRDAEMCEARHPDHEHPASWGDAKLYLGGGLLDHDGDEVRTITQTSTMASEGMARVTLIEHPTDNFNCHYENMLIPAADITPEEEQAAIESILRATPRH